MVPLQDFGELLEQPHGLVQQIVKIHRIRLCQSILVHLVAGGDLLFAEIAARLRLKFGGRQQAILCASQLVEDGFVPQHLFLNVQRFHALFHQPAAVVGIVDREMRGIAELFPLAAQDACAKRVEGARHHFAAVFAQHLGKPLFQLARRFVGEGDREDPPRGTSVHRAQLRDMVIHRHFAAGAAQKQLPILVRQLVRHGFGMVSATVADDLRHAVDQHRCFAGTGAGEQQQRAIGVEHRLLLPVVHTGKLPL